MKRTIISLTLPICCLVASSLMAQVDVRVVDAVTKVTTRTVTETTIQVADVVSTSETSQPGETKESTAPVGVIRAAIGSSVNAFDTEFAAATIANPADGMWLIVKPGKYLVIVQPPNSPAVFSPLVVPGSNPPTDPPVDPPVGDFADLLELARENIPSDQTSVNALGSAWLARLKALPESTPLPDVRIAIGKVRAEALSMIRDPGAMGWNKFLLAVDVWFSSQPPDTMTRVRYVDAITALADLMAKHK